MSIIQSESYKKGIVLSTFFNFGAKGLSFFNNILIAYYFGTSASTDLYFYMVGLIITIGMFINGSTTAVIIPEAINIKLKEGINNAQKFLNFFLYLFGFLSLIPSLALLFYPVVTLKTFSKFSEPVLSSNATMIMLFFIIVFFMTINNYLKEVMGMFHFFTAPMIMSLINSICCLIFIFLFHSTLSVTSISVGLIFGNVINFILLILFLRKKTGWSPHFTIISPRYFKNIFFAQSGCLATTLSNLVPPYLLSGLGAGVISAINFSRQITEIPSSFITVQMASVSGIKFNTLFAANEHSQLNEVFIKAVSFLVFILTPVCGLIFIFSKEIVTILFSRGAFNAASIEYTSTFCKLFILSVPLIALDQLSARMLIAAKKIPQSFWYQIGSNLFFIFTVMILLPYIQSIAFPIAILINYIVNVFVQPVLFRYLCPFINYRQILIKIVQIALLNIIISVVIYYGFVCCGLMHLSSLLIVIMGIVFYFALIVIINLMININRDFNSLLKKVLLFLKMDRLWNTTL